MPMKASAFSASPVLDAPQRTVARPSSPVRTAREPSPNVCRTPVAGLADRHAGALYRPVPPVDVDDDGYPYGDEAPMEGDHHDAARRYASDALETRLKHREDRLRRGRPRPLLPARQPQRTRGAGSAGRVRRPRPRSCGTPTRSGRKARCRTSCWRSSPRRPGSATWTRNPTSTATSASPSTGSSTCSANWMSRSPAVD